MAQKAAFFRLEGVLSRRPALGAAAYLTANAQALRDRVLKLGGLALAAPFAALGPLGDRTLATRLGWMGLRDMGEDRLVELSRDYAERHLIPSLDKSGVELVERARAEGSRIVLVSESLDLVASHVAGHLRADDLIANRMEMSNARATGRLVDPVVGTNLGTELLGSYGVSHDIDLRLSSAYAASGDDALLLGAVGRPCAVSPDRTLRRFARDNDWPVLEGRS